MNVPEIAKWRMPLTIFWVSFGIVSLMTVLFLFCRWAVPRYHVPLGGSFVFFSLLTLLLIELVCLPGSPVLEYLPYAITPPPLWDERGRVSVLGLFLSLVGTAPLFRRLSDRRVQELRPFRHAGSPGQGKHEALARQLAMALQQLTHVASSHPVVLTLLRGRQARRLRVEILRLLLVAERWGDVAMDYVLDRVNLPQLLAFGASGEAVALLRRHSTQLSVVTKAAVIDALQKNGLLSRSMDHQQWAAELLMSATGADLMLLKNLLDSGGDYHNLHKLVYSDIRCPDLRQAVLSHFSQQGQSSICGDVGRILKVVSDIDDTFYCSGGSFPAGVDVRYPKHAVYPGILQLFMEMDNQWREAKAARGCYMFRNSGQQPRDLEQCLCNLVFLSARPHIYKDMSERVSFQLFHELCRESRLHAMPTLLPGHLHTGVKAVLRSCLGMPSAWRSVGEIKFQTLVEYWQLYPAYSFVFFGDNGQGDMVTAELAMDASPRVLQVAFIHEVQPRQLTCTTLDTLSQDAREARWRELDIFLVKTPVEAAVIAHERGLLSTDGLRRVCESAAEDLDALAIRFPNFPHWRSRYAEVTADLQQASAQCGSDGCASKPDFEALQDELGPPISSPTRRRRAWS